MARLLSISGEKCIRKCIILELFAHDNHICYDCGCWPIEGHHENYINFRKDYDLDENFADLAYAMHSDQIESYKRDYLALHVFKWQPIDALLYRTLELKMDEHATKKAFKEFITKTRLTETWASLIVLPDYISQIMYVSDLRLTHDPNMTSDQYCVYARDVSARYQWLANLTGDVVQHINFRRPILEECNRIVKNYKRMIRKVTRFSEEFVQEINLPIIRRKIAIFSLHDFNISSGAMHAVNQLLNENYTIVSFGFSCVYENLYLEDLTEQVSSLLIPNILAISKRSYDVGNVDYDDSIELEKFYDHDPYKYEFDDYLSSLYAHLYKKLSLYYDDLSPELKLEETCTFKTNGILYQYKKYEM